MCHAVRSSARDSTMRLAGRPTSRRMTTSGRWPATSSSAPRCATPMTSTARVRASSSRMATTSAAAACCWRGGSPRPECRWCRCAARRGISMALQATCGTLTATTSTGSSRGSSPSSIGACRRCWRISPTAARSARRSSPSSPISAARRASTVRQAATTIPASIRWPWPGAASAADRCMDRAMDWEPSPWTGRARHALPRPRALPAGGAPRSARPRVPRDRRRRARSLLSWP